MEITKEVSIKSETDLHYKIIEYIRLYFSNIIIVPGLGNISLIVKFVLMLI